VRKRRDPVRGESAVLLSWPTCWRANAIAPPQASWSPLSANNLLPSCGTLAHSSSLPPTDTTELASLRKNGPYRNGVVYWGLRYRQIKPSGNQPAKTKETFVSRGAALTTAAVKECVSRAPQRNRGLSPKHFKHLVSKHARNSGSAHKEHVVRYLSLNHNATRATPHQCGNSNDRNVQRHNADRQPNELSTAICKSLARPTLLWRTSRSTRRGWLSPGA
jgi:hypothetical protein